MLSISTQQLIDFLGQPTKKVGHQYYFGCPICSQNGGDTHNDNLLFNEKKKLLKCFACDDGAKYVLKKINSQISHTFSNISNEVPSRRNLWWKINNDNLWQYWITTYQEQTVSARKWLNRCGITNETIDEWYIGYDDHPTVVNIGACVCFPMISLNHNGQLVGFELRQIGKDKVIRHTYDSPKCLCIISDNKQAQKLIICEGFKDAYSFMQILKQKGQQYNFTILTPSHGVNSIIEPLKDVNFTRYQKCFLLLDNDEAGSQTTDKIIDKYNFFKDVRPNLLQGCKDVNELWLKQYA